MLQENKFDFSLQQVSDFFAHNTSVTHPSLPAENLLDDFAFETYWGFLFWTFKDILQSSFSALSCDLSIGSFYLEKIFETLQESKSEPDLWHKSLEAIRKLDQGVNCFNKFVALFRTMQIEHSEFRSDDIPEFMALDNLLFSRIDTFKSKLDSLQVPYAGEISFHSPNSPKNIVACPNRITRGIDFLLLFAYQSIIFHGATKLQIKLAQDQNSDVVDIVNNGSSSLRNQTLKIDTNQKLSLIEFHPNDRKQVAWLMYTLHFFKDLNASLLVRNESGKNIISLNFPASKPARAQ